MPKSKPQVPATVANAATLEVAEARKALTDAAWNGFGAIPPEEIASLVLSMTPDATFDVRRAALDALRRRRAFAVRDGLEVDAKPERGAALGYYTTKRAAAGSTRQRADRTRPYSTLLESVRPIAGSCDCPDFSRSSLGVCKHLLVVIDAVFENDRRLAKALSEDPDVLRRSRLSWDARLPLGGSIDRLHGLRLDARGPIIAGVWRDLFVGGRPDARVLARPDERRRFATLVHAAFSRKGRARPTVDATPAARAVVTEELGQAERRARAETAANLALPHLADLKRSLYPYQRQGVERFLRTGRILLADDMGLGKTTQAIAACHALFAAKMVRKGLVIVPASLKPQWLREWRETTDTPVTLLDGAPNERKKLLDAHRAGFVLLNYEQLLRDEAWVRAVAPDIVVIDEAQRIKNYATKSAEAVKRLDAEYRLVLTGTPMENRLDELASILDWIDDVALAPKWRLEPFHVERGTGDGEGDHGGVKNLGALRARMAPVVVRRARSEVLKQLPRRTDTRVPVEMTAQQRAEHDALDLPIAKIVGAARNRPLTQEQFLRLMRLLLLQRVISNGLGQLRFDEVWPTYAKLRPDDALLEGLFSPKLFELRRLVRDLAVEQRRKVVVFSQWRRMLRLAAWSLRDVLGDAGLEAVFFTGAETQKARTRNVVAFHDDPRIAVMLLSDAGGVGLNLQRAASACINLELPWNPAVLEQRVSRIYRIGQKRPIDVFHLVSEVGIEAHIASIVGSKQAFFSELFDGTSDAIRFEDNGSFLSRIERLVGAVPPSNARSKSTRAASSASAEAEPEVDTEAVDPIADTLDGALTDELVPPPRTDRSPTLAANGAADGAGIELLPGLRIESTSDGGVRIEAPPETARVLVGLLEGLAKLVAGAARPR